MRPAKLLKRMLVPCVVICWMAMPSPLPADTLRGVVLDEDGQPIARARVDIAVGAPKVGPALFCPSCYADCAKWTRTDDRGRFEIDGLSPTLKFRLLATAPERLTRMTKLLDPLAGPVTLRLSPFPPDLPAHRLLEGVVKTKEGAPIPGALVEPVGAKTPQRRWWGQVDGVQPVVTGDDGRFRMPLSEDYQGVDVEITATGYAGAQVDLLTPGEGPHEIVVPVGTSVTGRLVKDGKPAAGVRVAVVQADRTAGRLFIKAVAATTDREGRFTIEHLPADQQYAVFSPVGDGVAGPVLTTKVFQARDDGQTRDLGELTLQDGLTLSGRVVRADGRPLPKDATITLGRDPAWDLIEIPVDAAGRFTADHLPPETYRVRIAAKGFELVRSELHIQALGPLSFGVRLTESLSDLRIPIRREQAEEPLTAQAEEPATPNAGATPDAGAIKPPTPAPAAVRPNVELTDEPTPSDGPRISVRGYVVDEAGRPLGGAEVFLRAQIGGEPCSMGLRHNRDVLARTRTDAGGWFTLIDIPIPLRLAETISDLSAGRGGAEVLVLAEGRGLGWAEVERLDPQEPLRFVLQPQADVRGVVRDEAGEPIAGAVLDVGEVGPPGGSDFGFREPDELNLSLSQVEIEAETNAEGRFALPHIPAGHWVGVRCEAHGFAGRGLIIDTTSESPSDEANREIGAVRSQLRLPVQSAPVELTLTKAIPLEIRVRDHHDKAVSGGAVYLVDSKRHFAGWVAVDADGLARLALKEPGFYSVQYAADPLAPRLSAQAEIEVKGGEETRPVEIRLAEPRWLTGRVRAPGSDRGVPGVYVVCAAADAEDQLAMAVSGPDGKFRIPTRPGTAHLRIARPVAGFYVPDRRPEREPEPVTVEIPADGEMPPAVLELARGLVLTGQVTDAAGKPVAGAMVRAENVGSPYGSAATRTGQDGWFELSGLAPQAETLVTAVAGATADRIVIPAADFAGRERVEQVRLTLRPGIQLTGRVTRDGRPQPGVTMKLFRTLPGSDRRYALFAVTKTDADGHYIVGGLSPGDGYRFVIETRDSSTAPGWRHQSPSIHRIDEDASGVIELPEAKLVGRGQSLSGIVVDPQGRPLSGITVSARIAEGPSLSRPSSGPPPWTDTDEQGRFRLRQLPDRPIELLVYRSNPEGGRIHYPAKARPAFGQQDIRVVLDPNLQAEVESLD